MEFFQGFSRTFSRNFPWFFFEFFRYFFWIFFSKNFFRNFFTDCIFCKSSSNLCWKFSVIFTKLFQGSHSLESNQIFSPGFFWNSFQNPGNISENFLLFFTEFPSRILSRISTSILLQSTSEFSKRPSISYGFPNLLFEKFFMELVLELSQGLSDFFLEYFQCFLPTIFQVSLEVFFRKSFYMVLPETSIRSHSEFFQGFATEFAQGLLMEIFPVFFQKILPKNFFFSEFLQECHS